MVSQGVSAQMTLNDCLVYARDHSPRNLVNRIEVCQAAMDTRLAASDLMPSVGLSSSGSLSFGRNIDPETNTYDNRKTLYTGFGLSMSLPLFDGLVSVNNLKAAKAGRLRREKAEARLDLETAMRELGAADARVTAEETAYKTVQRKFELGGASAIDLYTSGAKQAAARANREGKRIQKIISRIVLGYYNGEKLIK